MHGNVVKNKHYIENPGLSAAYNFGSNILRLHKIKNIKKQFTFLDEYDNIYYNVVGKVSLEESTPGGANKILPPEERL